jgi:type VI secretion system ImpJ/VasE family protein
MRFEEFLHWNDGQFLQPHHFQYLQRFHAEYNRLNRCFSLPHPFGLIDFELDAEALSGCRVVIRRFSAIMPDGLELSSPGNCILKPLDLRETLKQHPSELTVYLAVPQWSEYEGNLGEDERGNKPYMTQQKRRRDENSGDNEIALITRRINARLFTNLDNFQDMQTLPLLKLTVLTHDNAESAVSLNEAYIPPFMLLTKDNPLFDMAIGLLVNVRRCRDKTLNDVTLAKITDENMAGPNVHRILRLKALTVYEARLSSLLVSGYSSPFALYLELISFLSELMSIDPMNGIREIQRYVHEDSAPQFKELLNDIRSFIMETGGVGYRKLLFVLKDGYLCAPFETQDIGAVKDLYLAVKTEREEREAISALELGDTFKIISPSAKTMRIRGIKLTHLPFPPRFLPVLNRTLWFKLDLEASMRVWREICEEKGMVIDYLDTLFPGLEVALYIVLEDT